MYMPRGKGYLSDEKTRCIMTRRVRHYGKRTTKSNRPVFEEPSEQNESSQSVLLEERYFPASGRLDAIVAIGGQSN